MVIINRPRGTSPCFFGIEAAVGVMLAIRPDFSALAHLTSAR
jgi:hypothetical protein